MIVESLAEIAQRSFWDEWSNVTCPTLAVLGQTGIGAPAENDEMLRRRPDTVALSVAGTGHDVHLERTDVLRQVLHRFLEDVT